ncbi:hypothetical protein [uncultured Jatrophihabitans sp.]|uniref:hypothetical protein n=1 Tax=uncultured Jatrophihabitans sp. TaxID=1610747 RepID=UPI0035CBD7A5
MIGFALLLFPFVLLGFVLLMGRVEEPLNHIAVEREVEGFLASANDGELDQFIREGAESGLRRLRNRLRPNRRRQRRQSAAQQSPVKAHPR